MTCLGISRHRSELESFNKLGLCARLRLWFYTGHFSLCLINESSYGLFQGRTCNLWLRYFLHRAFLWCCLIRRKLRCNSSVILQQVRVVIQSLSKRTHFFDELVLRTAARLRDNRLYSNLLDNAFNNGRRRCHQFPVLFDPFRVEGFVVFDGPSPSTNGGVQF